MLTIGHWQPKIGDPSLVGWFTVFSYYLCAALGLVYCLKGWQRTNTTGLHFRIWITVVILVLGISKHFNLPGAITEIGRLVAHQLGGYDARRWVQGVMMLVVTIGLLVLVRRWITKDAFRAAWERGAPEILCLSVLCSLAVLRAISLHQVGALLATEVIGVRLNWIVELAGIHALVVILLTRLCAKTSKRSVPAAL